MATKTRKSADERKHDYYLSLAILLRQGRLVRMPAGVKRISFEQDGQHVDVYASSTYAGFGYVVKYGAEGYECGCKSFEHRHSCQHTKDANRRALARYHAQQIAEQVLGAEFAQDIEQHVEDSIRSGEFADPTSCYNCGALCRGGVCMDCLSIAA